MVNFSTSIVTLPDSKTGRSHRVISKHACDFLKGIRPRNAKGFVFRNKNGDPPGDISSSWGKIRKRAGLPDLRIHDLRHNFISTLVNNGVSLKMAAAASGHKSLRSVERYSHLSDAAVHLALDKHAPTT